jgi:hypothetical protein
MPTTTTTTTAPLTLWLTDRSRWKKGVSSCARARYLGYHAGPGGYGITARRESLPLATGISVHQGEEMFCEILKREQRLPDIHETRDIVATIVAGYLARVEARGYRGILGGEHTEETIKEQAALISGLLWALRLHFLPWLHENYKVVAIEKERLHFLTCACGAPKLDTEEHIRRGCTGKALMIRTDLLAEQRRGRSLAYFETKTTGWESDAWADQWETDPQLAMGTVDAQELWGAEVTELFIVGLAKGRRAKDRYNPEDMKRQQSPLCYGYVRPANPPVSPEDWLPAYEWVNDNGEVKRASRAHKRKGIWHLAESDWPVWRAYHNNDPELTPEEFWVQIALPASVLKKTCFVLGPMNRQDQQLKSFLAGIKGEEDRWQETLWDLYALENEHGWASDEFQAHLDQRVPCSWACRPFGREHECEFVRVCHRHTGWDDPWGSGHYQPRLPHHDPELQQAVARGLLVAEAEEADEEE